MKTATCLRLIALSFVFLSFALPGMNPTRVAASTYCEDCFQICCRAATNCRQAGGSPGYCFGKVYSPCAEDCNAQGCPYISCITEN